MAKKKKGIDGSPNFTALEQEFDAVSDDLEAWQTSRYQLSKDYWQGLNSMVLDDVARPPKTVQPGNKPSNETQDWTSVIKRKTRASYECDFYNRGGDLPGWILRAEILYNAQIWRKERYFGPRSDAVFADWRVRHPEGD